MPGEKRQNAKGEPRGEPDTRFGDQEGSKHAQKNGQLHARREEPLQGSRGLLSRRSKNGRRPDLGGARNQSTLVGAQAAAQMADRHRRQPALPGSRHLAPPGDPDDPRRNRAGQSALPQDLERKRRDSFQGLPMARRRRHSLRRFDARTVPNHLCAG